jgi:hypothetical protein
MADPSQTVPSDRAPAGVATYDWRGLHLHILTREPLSADQARTIERALRKVGSVGQFADLLGMVLGRRVRIRTERPSADIWLEVG